MAEFIQLVLSGGSAGVIYALAALGFTLLWQASGTINFAQGEFVMVGAFLILFFIGSFGVPLWAALLLACAVASLLLGAGFKFIVVDPLRRHGVIPLVIATLGVSIGLKQFMKAGYSAGAFPFPSLFPDGNLALGGAGRLGRRHVGAGVSDKRGEAPTQAGANFVCHDLVPFYQAARSRCSR